MRARAAWLAVGARLGALGADEGGQALVEYGLIMAALLAGLVGAAQGIKAAQAAVFRAQSEAFSSWRSP